MKFLFWILLLALCGKAYYLLGFEGHLRPTAPKAVILIKDLLLWAVLASAFIPFQKIQYDKKTAKLFLILCSTFFFSSLLHLAFEKDAFTWAQHYFRNVISVLFVFAACFVFFSAKGLEKLFVKLVLVFFILNVAVGSIQLFFFPGSLLDRIRPLGLVGDPITLSSLIFMSLPLALSRLHWLWSLVVVFFCGYVLNSSASVSALLAVTLAGPAFFLGWLILKKKQCSQFPNIRPIHLLLIVSFVLSFWMWTYSPRDTLLGKAKSTVEGAIKKATSFLPRKPSSEVSVSPALAVNPEPTAPAPTAPVPPQTEQKVADSHDPIGRLQFLAQGRLKSLKRFADLCTPGNEYSSFSKCLFGDYDSPAYARLDNNWASLMVNWGLLAFLSFYFFVGSICVRVFRLLLQSRVSVESRGKIYLSYWVILNVIFLDITCSNIYRYPINFLMMLCLSYLAVQISLSAKSIRSLNED